MENEAEPRGGAIARAGVGTRDTAGANMQHSLLLVGVALISLSSLSTKEFWEGRRQVEDLLNFRF